jgi:hypothetical protein
MTGCVLVGKLDGFVLCRRNARSGQCDSGDQGFDEHTFHELSPENQTNRTYASTRQFVIRRTRSDDITENQ